MKYVFNATSDFHALSPPCIICGDMLPNEAMKLSKLLWHMKTMQPALDNKPLEFLEKTKHEQDGQKQLLMATTSK